MIYNLALADHNGNKDAHKTTPPTFPFHPASLATAFNLRPPHTLVTSSQGGLSLSLTPPTISQAVTSLSGGPSTTSSAVLSAVSQASTALNLSSSSRPTSVEVDTESPNIENNSRTRSPSTASRESYKHETDHRRSSVSPSKEGK